MNSVWKYALVAAAAGLMFVSRSAKANSVELTFTGISANLGTVALPVYAYTYDAILTPGDQVSTGDQVEVAAFNQGTATGASFLLDAPPSGANYGAGVAGTMNLTTFGFGTSPAGIVFTYDGASPLIAASGGNLDLGKFVINSSFNTGTTSNQYTTSEQKNLGGVYVADLYTAPTVVAAPGGFTITPLPRSAFGAAGLLGLASLWVRGRKVGTVLG
jgi:hypothetical protein